MEITLIFLLFIPYLILKFYLTDHRTEAEKQAQQFQEGISLYQQQANEAAFTYFDTAIKQNPRQALAYLYRAKCNYQLDNLYSALYDYDQALSFDNTLVEGYMDRGKLYYQLQDYERAFRDFDRAVWFYRNEDAESHRWRGLARLKIKQVPQSVRDFDRAIVLGDEEAYEILRSNRLLYELSELSKEKRT